MIDVKKIEYRAVAITWDGMQIDLTGLMSSLGWSESEKDLACKITLTLTVPPYDGKKPSLTELIQVMTPIFIYAKTADEFKEVIRGTVYKVEIEESARDFKMHLDCSDESQALRHNMDNFFFTEDQTSTAILEEIFGKWEIPHRFEIQDVKHAKKVFRQKYLSDMVTEILEDVKEKDGGVYFVRAKESVIEIIPRGTNETIYHFDVDDNIVRARDSFDISRVVTRVQVVVKEKEEGKQKIETTLDGKTDYGVRQVIYMRGNKETLEEAEKAAKKILDEQGEPNRDQQISAPDVPELRKNDRIRVHSNLGDGYFFCKAVHHDAAQRRMTLDLDFDKEYSEQQGGESYDVSKTNEANGSSPP